MVARTEQQHLDSIVRQVIAEQHGGSVAMIPTSVLPLRVYMSVAFVLLLIRVCIYKGKVTLIVSYAPAGTLH